MLGRVFMCVYYVKYRQNKLYIGATSWNNCMRIKNVRLLGDLWFTHMLIDRPESERFFAMLGHDASLASKLVQYTWMQASYMILIGAGLGRAYYIRRGRVQKIVSCAGFWCFQDVGVASVATRQWHLATCFPFGLDPVCQSATHLRAHEKKAEGMMRPTYPYIHAKTDRPLHRIFYIDECTELIKKY